MPTLNEARHLLMACMTTSGLPHPDEMNGDNLAVLHTLDRDQCELVALMVAAAYSNGARDMDPEAGQ